MLKPSRSIFRKTLLATVSTIILVVSFVTFYSIREETEQLKQNTISNAEHVSKFIASSVQSAFWSLNWIYVDEMLQDTVQFMDKQLLFVIVAKGNGEVYLSSDEAYHGESVASDLLSSEELLIENYQFPKHQIPGMALTRPVVIGNKTWWVILGLSLEPVQEASVAMVKRHLYWASLFLIVGLVFSYFFSRSISHPINKLAEAVKQVSADNLELNVDITAQDEVGVLHDSFRWMLTDLARAHKSLEDETRVNAAIAELSEAVISMPSIADISIMVLEHARTLTNSPLGFVGYFESGSKTFICPALSQDEGSYRYSTTSGAFSPSEFERQWGVSLDTAQIVQNNDLQPDPEGVAQIRRFVYAPARLADSLLGYIGVANSKERYVEREVGIMVRLAALYAIALQRKQALDSLQNAEEMYRGIFENAVEGIFRTSPEGRFLSVNPTMARVSGYDSPEQMITEVTDITTQFYVDPNRRDELLARLNSEGSVREFDVDVRRRDGSIVPITASVQLITRKDGTRYLEGIATDNTERLQKREAQRERDAAEAANQAKSEFLAHMSHEIRTPLNAILGVGELLEENRPAEEQKALVKMLKVSGRNLLELINDILDLSKIESGKLTLEEAPFRPVEMIHETCSLLNVRAQEKGLDLECFISPSMPPALVGDRARLRQILLNLVGNAIKFTHQGTVNLTAGARDLGNEIELLFDIKDTGVGIPQEKLEMIFDDFVQADSSTTRRFGGSGLGLAICKTLTAMMGGRIWVESNEGRGSVFSFTAKVQKTAPSVVLDRPDSSQAWRTKQSDSPLKVLLVDDSQQLRELLGFYLSSDHFIVDFAENGQVGLEKFLRNEFDIVLLDMEMPVMDGYTAVSKMRQSEKGGDIPVIALTAHAMVGDRKRCLEAGCTEYLSKPVSKADLLRMMRKHTG